MREDAKRRANCIAVASNSIVKRSETSVAALTNVTHGVLSGRSAPYAPGNVTVLSGRMHRKCDRVLSAPYAPGNVTVLSDRSAPYAPGNVTLLSGRSAPYAPENVTECLVRRVHREM